MRAFSFVILSLVMLCGAPAGFAESPPADAVHTPAAGSAERKAILEALHAEYTTGSGAGVKFLVKHFKAHQGWAWINVVPLNPSGQPEGDEWPSLLRLNNGKWTIVDLVAIAQPFNESEGPPSPSARFLKAIQKKYPTVPGDIFPAASK
ncbi:MAG TPA: hypothetical protein VGO11_10800 [Chthoniobacteraceae bacterium]|jgi:hypothetical protein|nr:hypothetical protein [Chthoniobacteraceae bacterium]